MRGGGKPVERGYPIKTLLQRRRNNNCTVLNTIKGLFYHTGQPEP